jgi:hypothetical protein
MSEGNPWVLTTELSSLSPSGEIGMENADGIQYITMMSSFCDFLCPGAERLLEKTSIILAMIASLHDRKRRGQIGEAMLNVLLVGDVSPTVTRMCEYVCDIVHGSIVGWHSIRSSKDSQPHVLPQDTNFQAIFPPITANKKKMACLFEQDRAGVSRVLCANFVSSSQEHEESKRSHNRMIEGAPRSKSFWKMIAFPEEVYVCSKRKPTIHCNELT